MGWGVCDDRKLEVNLYNAGFIMLLSNVASYSRLTGFSRMSLTGNKPKQRLCAGHSPWPGRVFIVGDA